MATEFDALIEELRRVADQIATARVAKDQRKANSARRTLENLTTKLIQAAVELDPVLRPKTIFDPSAPETAGRVVALALMAQPRHPLAAIPEFYGAGVYAIYYRGGFKPYEVLSGTEHPIYVGKADPDAQSAQDAIAQGAKLSARLREHAKNIGRATSTLSVDDFDCRFLVVQSGYQTAAESYLINLFAPIWNSETKIAYGLGKHGDSSATRGNKRSPWDTMHPGRSWAESTSADQKPSAQIVAEIGAHLTKHPPFVDIAHILEAFMRDMRQMSTEEFESEAEGTVVITSSETQEPSA